MFINTCNLSFTAMSADAIEGFLGFPKIDINIGG